MKTTENIAILPDSIICIDNMHQYGYMYDGMLPLNQAEAEHLLHENVWLYCLYPNNTESMVDDLEELREHAQKGGIFGIEMSDWETLCAQKGASYAKRNNH